MPPFPRVPASDALVFAVTPKGLLVREGTASIGLPGAAELGVSGVTFTGVLEGRECWAVGLAAAPQGFVARPLRALFDQMGEARWMAAGRASQLLHFHETHAHCGRCGARTSASGEEHARRCEACELVAYPRLSPAIIVLVRNGAEALLARNARSPGGWFSTLAGFVEPGESLEEAVAREVREEVGIEVADLRYFASQPWPFPHSLMVGFTAAYAGGRLTPDGAEILEARWCRAEELPTVPPRPSIARRLIDAWVDEVGGGRRPEA
jgi:NAD+ diphosphatase